MGGVGGIGGLYKFKKVRAGCIAWLEHFPSMPKAPTLISSTTKENKERR